MISLVVIVGTYRVSACRSAAAMPARRRSSDSSTLSLRNGQIKDQVLFTAKEAITHVPTRLTTSSRCIPRGIQQRENSSPRDLFLAGPASVGSSETRGRVGGGAHRRARLRPPHKLLGPISG